jgi:transcriptional antiterminator RfaH
MAQVNGAASSFWFVAQTSGRAEQKASELLNQKAVTTYLPRLLVRRRHGSRRWQALEPLFPGYLFIQFEPRPETIYRVRWTPGIMRLLGDGEMPIPISDEVVRYLQGRESHHGFIAPLQPLAAGQRVRFKSGPFSMLEGIIERPVPREDRVRVLLHLVNMVVAVEVEADVLEVG